MNGGTVRFVRKTNRITLYEYEFEEIFFVRIVRSCTIVTSVRS